MRRDYTALEIATMTREEVVSLPMGGLRITFCDGALTVCKTTAVQESWFYWQLFAEANTKGITEEHFVGNNYDTSVHKRIAGKVFWSVFYGAIGVLQPGQGLDLFWDLSRRIYQVGNEVYNSSALNDGEHLSSLDIMDVIEILEHPTVKEVKALYELGEVSVDDAHTKIYDLMGSPDISLIDNELARCVRFGIYSKRQIQQMIGPRAVIPDINGEAFKTPVVPGYAEGFNSYYDRAIESRTASIAYANAKGPLEDSQYNNRQCQMLGGVLRGIYQGDCGTSLTVPWQVRTENDLKLVAGKYRMAGGAPVMTTGKEKELIGETLAMRSITTCGNHDSTASCAVCLGLAAWTTPPDTVFGHHLMIEPLAKISQTILSTKHVIASTKCLYVRIDNSCSRWIKHDPENFQRVMLKDAVDKGRHIKVRILQSDAMFINDVVSASDPALLVPGRITDINILQIIEYDADGVMKGNHDIDLTVAGLGCPLSHEMLLQARKAGWEMIGDSIEIDMEGWDYDLPLVVSPRRGDDIMSILRDVQGFLHSQNKPGAIRAVDHTNPGDAINSLLALMIKKIDVNFVNVEVFVRALMSRIDEFGKPTYELPVGGEPFVFVTMKDAILNRSVGAGLGFERQDTFIHNPGSYNRHNLKVPGSELDAIWGRECSSMDTVGAVFDSPASA